MTFAGWIEIAFIVLLSFVIIGPKDFPKLLFTLGRFLQSLQTLSREFMTEFEAIHHVSEMEKKAKKKKKD